MIGTIAVPTASNIKFAQVSGHAVQVRAVFGASLNPTVNAYSLIIKETGITWGDENANDPLTADPNNVRPCGGTFSAKEFNPMRAIDKYGNEFSH